MLSRDEFVKDVLARESELKAVWDAISEIYTTTKGDYELTIRVDHDFEDNKYYNIQASKVVKNCACRLDDDMAGISNEAINKACAWFFEVVDKFEENPWLTEEDLLAEADAILSLPEHPKRKPAKRK